MTNNDTINRLSDNHSRNPSRRHNIRSSINDDVHHFKISEEISSHGVSSELHVKNKNAEDTITISTKEKTKKTKED
jgi:hypothetical protein|tara:strand:- start:752 stop:979 length:228 start_codon:yes stop_codon:yes gene_type:complete